MTTDGSHELVTAPAQTGRAHRAARIFVICASVLLVLAGIGLVRFAGDVSALSRVPAVPPKADGIVVLTGGSDRIADAIALLGRSQGRRLLISGVNPSTTRSDIRRHLGASPELFRCCIDLGYSALNTQGNALETGRWANRHRFKSLIVVTSGYHMPRTLVELTRAMPDVVLVPHPVSTEEVDLDRWWTNRRATSLMTREYAKYLLALVRIRLRSSNADGVMLSAGTPD